MTAKLNLKDKFTKKKLTENLSLKIISLVIAIGLWFIVISITDPVINYQYKNIKVQIANEDVITSAGNTLEIIDGTNIIPVVNVKAPRSVINELGTDDIIAVADMKNLSNDGTTVDIEFSTSKYSDKIESIRTSFEKVHVNIETRKSIQLPIYATTSGEIESGFILGDVEPNQNQVRVSGPESVISRVKKASVDVMVTGFTSNISTQADIVLFDENNEIIPQDNLSLNINSVKIDVEILATKKVPIAFATSGTPSEGFAVTGEVECDPELVVIAGNKDVMAKVNEIFIPASELNITGQTENMFSIIDLEKYLPGGVRLGDSSFGGKASITVYIEPIVEKEFTLHLRNIGVTNVPEGYSVKIQDDDGTVNFTLLGLAQDLEKIQLSSLGCHVDFDDFALLNDMSKFKKGEYELYLVMNQPDGVEISKPVGVSVYISEKED